MWKSVKNSSQLTDEQSQIVNGIIVTVSARLYYLLRELDNPEDYAKKFLRSASAKEFRSLTYMAANFTNLCGPNKGFFPSDLNQQLATVLAEESTQYLKGPALRKILKLLEGEGILFNTKGKENIKHDLGRNFNKQQKGAYYSSAKREGRYSHYKVTNDVQKLLDVMSNPTAIQIIHSTLKNSGLLTKVLEKFFFVSVHLFTICNNSKTAENSLFSFLSVLPEARASPLYSEIKNSGIQPIGTIFNSINDKTLLQPLASQFANAISEDSILNTLYIWIAVIRL